MSAHYSVSAPPWLKQDDVATTKPAAQPDLINHPPHYRAASGLEAIDVIEAFELGHHLGDAVAYILRADRKGDAIGDLEKAAWYIRREIERRMKVAR